MLPVNFHFLRPLWFLALLPAGLLFLTLWKARLKADGWARVISGALLPHLLDGRDGARQRWPLFLLLFAWLLAITALSGPVWKKLPQAVQQKEDALVIIQDLSLSFYVQDLSPNRLTRTWHKLLDLLQARQEGLTALVVYSGDAHVVCPLTDDTATIAGMVNDLEPGILPSYGSNLVAAVELALRLFRDSSLSRGRILLLSDEVEPEMAAEVGKLLRGQDVTLSILGVGTAAGGPIPKGDSGFLQDRLGNIVIPRLDSTVLAKLAAEGGGRYSEIRIDDGDFNYLLGADSLLPRAEEYRQVEREFDQWQEEGYWLLLALLPLALLAFRRGWLITALMLALLLPARPSQALEWRDLWLRKDQQAALAFDAGDSKTAATLFQQPEWKGAAEYRVGNYAGAVEGFVKGNSADANYNRGNGLAKLGKLEEAIQAYDQALKLDPDSEDAKFNRQLVEELLRQPQQPQEQKQDHSGQGQNGQKNQKADEGGSQNQSGGQNQKQNDGGKDQSGQPGGQDKSDKPGQTGKPGEAGQKGQPQDDASASDGQEKAGKQEPGQVGSEQKNHGVMVGKQSPEGKKAPGAANAELDSLSPELRQELEQRLRQVPDNPGGLLRRKFEYQYKNSRQRGAGEGGKIW